MPSHRILYVGHDLTLLKSLMEALEDYRVVRCPGGSVAHTLIESQIIYALLLLDDELPETTGRELAYFTKGVQHRERTPIIILSLSKAKCDGKGVCFEKPDNFKSLVSAIKRLLAEAPNVEG
jgi:DNA-binding response OmpR family regulator